MMSIAFSGLIPQSMFVYVDDLIIIGNSEKNHLQNFEKVFQICRDRNLKLNLLKSYFFQEEVTYLGNKNNKYGIQPDPTKFKAIKDFLQKMR